MSTPCNVQVLARFRPENDYERSNRGEVAVRFSDDGCQVRLVSGLGLPGSHGLSIPGDSHRFDFDRIFDPTASQATIFEHVGQPLVEAVLEGYNGTIFACECRRC